jgi:hypothetical protein
MLCEMAEEAGNALLATLERPCLLKVPLPFPRRTLPKASPRLLSLSSHPHPSRPSPQRMTKSHVVSGFWLGGFGGTAFRPSLPSEDTNMSLEHRGEHWEVRWLVDNHGLSGGWGAFAKGQQLAVDDFVLFEKKCEGVLKVYLFRWGGAQNGAMRDRGGGHPVPWRRRGSSLPAL